jgi:hypothetical protein
VLRYVARLLGSIAERAAARAEEAGSVTAGADSSEYVGTGAATGAPPPAWLERVLQARARMRRHVAPRRAGGEPPPADTEEVDEPAPRPAAAGAVRGERIHLTARHLTTPRLTAPRREAAAEAAWQQPRKHTASPQPAAASEHDRRDHAGAAGHGDRVRIAAATHREGAESAPVGAPVTPAPLAPAPRSPAPLAPAPRSPAPLTTAHAEQSERGRQRRAAENAISRVWKRAVQAHLGDEPSQVHAVLPPEAQPETVRGHASEEMFGIPVQVPGRRVMHASGASPVSDVVTGRANGEASLSGRDPHSSDAQSRVFLHADRPARSDERTSRVPADWRNEPVPADQHAVNSAELPWPSLPDADHEAVDAGLLLREWQRLQRIRAEQRGRGVERVSFLIERTGLRLSCLLNPETLTIRRRAGVRTRRSIAGALTGTTLADEPLLMNGGGETELTLDLLFDVTLLGSTIATENVRDLTRPFVDMAENLAGDDAPGKPPLVRLIWGRSWNIPGVVVAVAERFEYFTPSGEPRRSWLRMRMLRVDEQPVATAADPPSVLLELAAAGGNAGDEIRTHQVRGSGGSGDLAPAAERLEEIAWRYYGNPALWRVLALYNAIDDPARLQPGQLLQIPALEALTRAPGAVQ